MKSQTLHCTIGMQVQAHADCPRCDSAVSSQRPNCPRCGLWMPWGDDCVEQLAEAVRAHWTKIRDCEQSQAPPLQAVPRPSLRTPAPPRGSLALAASGGALLGAVLVMGLQVLAPAAKRPTGICEDGTATFAKTRSGACANHGGLREFYK